MEMMVPLMSVDLKINAAKYSQSGLVDILFDSLILSHAPHYDLSCSASIWAPTGQYDMNEPASPGKGK
jgi:hypothetical protein